MKDLESWHSSVRSDEGLTFETSGFLMISHGGNSTFINYFDQNQILVLPIHNWEPSQADAAAWPHIVYKPNWVWKSIFQKPLLNCKQRYEGWVVCSDRSSDQNIPLPPPPKHLTPFSQRYERKKKGEESKFFSLFLPQPAENNTYKNLKIG